MPEEQKNIRGKIKIAQKESMKSGDKTRLSTVRLIMATLKDRDISARSSGNHDGIGDSDILSMMQSMIKQRHDSIKMYKEGGRAELADREAEEIRVIETFLPEALSDEDMRSIIKGLVEESGAESMKDMGKVMGLLKSRYAGQLDMSKASNAVKHAICGS